MYQEYYGLVDKPFTLTPNPRYVFYSQRYREAEGQLLYGINAREGFMIVTGKPGTGKTTLCRDLIEKLDRQRIQSALIFNPFLNGVEMLAAVLTEFGVTVPPSSNRKELLDRLNQFLLAQLALGKSCVAIFDEAQHLSTEFLEQIRVLSNLETDEEKLIQIVLVGQPELLDKVRTPSMAQLDQRVSIRCTLTDLDQQETDRYIHHRLNIAGARGQIRFSPKAVGEIYRASGGVPRLINLIADRALLAGFAAQTRDIGVDHVQKAVVALRGEEPDVAPKGQKASRRSSRGRWAMALAAIVLLIGVGGAFAWWNVRQRPMDPEALYWRATLSAGPLQAERDLRQLVSTYPRSPRVNDALLRLAQLAMERGSRDTALRHLQKLASRLPAGVEHGRALLWTARVKLDAGDTTAACASLRGSIADSVSSNADLARQLDAISPACASVPGFVVAGDSSAVVPAGSPRDSSSAQPAADSSAARTTKRTGRGMTKPRAAALAIRDLAAVIAP